MTTAFDLYIAAENADLTEGRGPMQMIGIYTDPEAAVAAVLGHGVMGVGDGEVYRITVTDGVWVGSSLLSSKNMYYGYMQRRDGRWVYDYTDRRNEPDPDNQDYQQYLRLKARFE